uniref:Uncharacterized protein n=1 Tax=Rhizophora mucronata TaxID=61149 RepID=A0A2P2J719_RHIMU
MMFTQQSPVCAFKNEKLLTLQNTNPEPVFWQSQIPHKTKCKDINTLIMHL